MTSPSRVPLTALAGHASSRATGEFITIAGDLEVHLYLQGGRIAWGTTSAERFVFRRYLCARFDLEETLLQEALVECHRTRRPLGETLVRWKFLTMAQVREGLRAQVMAALGSLEQCPGAQTLFLPRGASFATYDAQLTFELEELMPRDAPRAPTSAQTLFELVERQAPMLAWAATFAGRELEASLRGTAPRAVLELVRRRPAEEDFVVVRSSRGNLVGAALERSARTLWCALPAETPLAPLVATLGALASRSAPVPPPALRGTFEHFGASHHLAGVSALLEQADGAAGVVVLDRSGSPDLWVVARQPVDLHALAQTAAQRQRVLDVDVFSARDAGPLAFQWAMVGDPRWWWFGSDLLTRAPASLWLALPRGAPQGLGWALLSTLVRELSVEEVTL